MEAEPLLRLAIAKAREAIALGQTPFGCAIAIGERVVAVAHNLVLVTTDITAHAEIVALREACAAMASIHLPGALVASTCEPCPMCMAALHWARVDTVVYGATIADATGAGFNELSLPAAELVRQGHSRVRLRGGLLAGECAALFDEWRAGGHAMAY
jgi:tRNA(Arg) A34 adenosine deaminase TadA